MTENKETLQEKIVALTKELESSSQDDTTQADLLLKRAHVYEQLQLVEKSVTDARIAFARNHSLEPQVNQLLARLQPTETKTEDPRVASFQHLLSDLNTADTSKVRQFVSSNDFVQVLLACGTVDTVPRVKSLAFMILTQLFNPANAEKYPFTFIIEQCAACFSHCLNQGKNDAKLLAYNTLIAIFQTSMTAGAAILCQEGTVEEMMDTVDFETSPVQLSIAQVLTIASSDKSCRKQILKYAVTWLVNKAGQSKTDPQLKAATGTALTKLRAQTDVPTDATPQEQPEETLEESMKKMHLTNESLVDSLQNIIKSKSMDANLVLNAVEGLAYACLKPETKDKLGKDAEFLKCLSTLAISTTNNADGNNNPLLFGIGTIFANLTMYRPVLDDQQKQMKKLRDLANAKQQQASGAPYKEEKEDPREDDSAVEERIKLCVSNGVSLAMMVLAKNASVNLRALAAQTYFHLVTPQAVRGQLLQQGIVKALLPLARTDMVAAQALAKLAITADPRLAFKGDTVLDLVNPFLSLCKETVQLRQFEGLMALTNLASVDDRVRLLIENADGMTVFENLQLSNNDMVQRAATEMVCNMTFCDPVFERYSDPKISQNRIRLLMILSDSEDPATRKASSGALAILANSPNTCEMILKVDKCYERIVRWLDAEETVDVQHRGIEVIRCLIQSKGKKVVDDLVKEQDVDKKLIMLVKNCQVQVVRSAAMEVLKLFVENGVQLKA